jgi:hypothetical protein
MRGFLILTMAASVTAVMSVSLFRANGVTSEDD